MKDGVKMVVFRAKEGGVSVSSKDGIFLHGTFLLVVVESNWTIFKHFPIRENSVKYNGGLWKIYTMKENFSIKP